ncbi:hypothetical protein TEQG_00338 [Trichophyton equinum CBS 127.97]|uniref:Uncharacterized protein n=1 Tax=Trichophyton equinum (strain ATCC MYA-4606 / CBS 127.97) TaxID=559882 RepID=F2PHB7_TRIEC|nr:hypothetical protein TEQG_00338 [Trichophyton equinum CBS 127.97]
MRDKIPRVPRASRRLYLRFGYTIHISTSNVSHPEDPLLSRPAQDSIDGGGEPQGGAIPLVLDDAICALLPWRGALDSEEPWISNRTCAGVFLSVPLKPHEVNQGSRTESLSICSTIASEASKRGWRSGYQLIATPSLCRNRGQAPKRYR